MLCVFDDQIKEDDMSRQSNVHGEKRNAYGQPEGKRRLGRPRHW